MRKVIMFLVLSVHTIFCIQSVHVFMTCLITHFHVLGPVGYSDVSGR